MRRPRVAGLLAAEWQSETLTSCWFVLYCGSAERAREEDVKLRAGGGRQIHISSRREWKGKLTKTEGNVSR